MRRRRDQITIEPGGQHRPSADQRAALDELIASGRLLEFAVGEGVSQLYVPYGPGRVVPVSVDYSGTGGGVAWHITVQVDPRDEAARPRCVRLILDPPLGGAIDTDTLRQLPLGRLVEEAVLVSAIELDSEGNPIGPIGEPGKTTLEEARRRHRRIEREHRRRVRRGKKAGRNAITDEHLWFVARVYTEAVRSGQPVAAVATHFGVPRPTASRWIQMCREPHRGGSSAGFLDPAPAPGVAGQARKEEHND